MTDRSFSSCFNQELSFPPLNITQECIAEIINKHELGTGLLRVVSSFYQRIVNVEEAFCIPFEMHCSDTSIGESA